MINYAQAKRLVEKATGPHRHTDQQAAAWAGLERALATHNPDRGTLQSWVTWCAKGCIANQGRGYARRARLGEPTDQIENAPVMSIPPDPLVRAAIERAFAALPPRQAEAARLVLVEELEQQDAAAVMGVSSQAVNQLVIRARARLKLSLRHLKPSPETKGPK